MEYQKPRLAMAMNDICGYGRSSLTAAYPVLAALNVQVCPLPTALLSHHYGYTQTPSFINLGEQLSQFSDIWIKEGFQFDAFFSGYLADPTQVDLALNFIRDFSPQWIYVDPVLGDHGALYKGFFGFEEAQAQAIRKLLSKAQIISPNLTETSLLLKRPYVPHPSLSEVREMLERLADFGVQYVCITGVVDPSQEYISTFCLDTSKNIFFSASSSLLPGSFHGTGDAFSSAVLGNLMQGQSFLNSVDRAVTYLHKSLELAVHFDSEICLEPTLPLLFEGTQNSKIHYF